MFVNNKKPKVLVTGGAGYIGSILTKKLLASNYKIVVLGTFYSNSELKNNASGDENMIFIRGDIRSREVLEYAIKGCQTIIHLANISEGLPGAIDKTLYESINYKAFLPILSMSEKYGIEKFIFVSSALVYGNRGTKIVSEDTPPNPSTEYGRHKVLCENELLKKNWPFTTVIIRPSSVCGYSPRMRFDLPHNAMIRDAFFKKEIQIPLNNNVRPTIHIDDFAEILKLLIEAPAKIINKRIFNAGYENFSWLEWAAMVKKVFQEDLKTISVPEKFNYSHALSTENVRNILGFVPSKKFKDAAAELVQQFKNKTIVNPYDDCYYNIRMIRKNNIQ